MNKVPQLMIIGPNHTEVRIGRARFVFSYDTLVAIKDEAQAGEGHWYVNSGARGSRTTSRHLNRSLNGSDDVTELDGPTFRALAEHFTRRAAN